MSNLYPQARADFDAALAAFRWTGGAVRLVEPITDPIVRSREWGRAEKDEYTMPFYPGNPEWNDDNVSHGPWVWRYGSASAGTGSRYAVLVTKVHADIAAYEGGPVIVTVLSPWQDAHPLAEQGYLDESYVAEKLTGGRAYDNRLHAGDLAALTKLIRILLGRDE